jgi:glycosyltransferase involved in cell wall biosynthesis
MKTQVAFDVSGLAWQYRTGVQNLYWAFVDAWAQQPKFHEDFDVLFYDRSGSFNGRVADVVGSAYASCAPTWWPDRLRRPLQAVIRTTDLHAPKLGKRVNHVWNWNIYNPSGCYGSITIPDVLPLEFPQWFDDRFLRLTEKSLRFAADHADYVFVISHDVKKRVAQLTGMSADRIRVVYPGIDAAYFSTMNFDTTATVLRKHGLESGRYLLSSGFLDPRKNLVRQLEAFSIALSRGAKGIKYALTGVRTSLSEDVIKIIDSPGMRSNVVFLGYVPKDELIALTSQSAALMYCSLAEGFGLPIVEAMAVGAPVITSANTSMQELATSRACLVDPCNIEEMALAILETVNLSVEQRLTQVNANRLFASSFTVENWLGGHLDAFAGHISVDRWL